MKVKNESFTKTEQRLLDNMAEIEVIDCHEHLGLEKNRTETPQDVFTLFSHYARLPLYASGLSEEDKKKLHDPDIPLEKRWKMFKPHWKNIRFTSYAKAALITAKDVYGFDEISDRTYKDLSETINAANTVGIYKRILCDRCNIRVALTQCNSTAVDSPLIPLMPGRRLTRIRKKSQLTEIFDKSDVSFNTLEEYLNLCKMQLEGWVNEGTVGIKFYSKPNTEPDVVNAQALFKQLMAGEELVADSCGYEPLENYLMHKIIDFAEELDLVVAMHSGVWGDFRNLDPRHMTTIALAHPNTRFDLYHLGIPDVRAAIMIGSMFPNVWLNLCWTHIISQELTCSGINEMLDMVPINKVLAFGGDYSRPVEKVVGHLKMAKEDIAKVLGARIDHGKMNFADASEIIHLWFWQNPLDLYTKVKIGAKDKGNSK